MASNILIIQGHPDPDQAHLGHALSAAYAEAARTAGHTVEELMVARLSFPWLKSAQDFEHGEVPATIGDAQSAMLAADHLLFIYPLWLGDMPAILKAFLEQTFRPGFVTNSEQGLGGFGKRRLKGKSARIVVTMGMPAPFYTLVYRAHSVRSFKRNILYFCGIKPVRTTLIGMAGGDDNRRQRWLQRMAVLGQQGK